MNLLLREYWPFLIAPLLGAVAVYWLLPQARRSRPVLGALVGGLAILAGAVILVREDANLAETILFYAFSGLTLLGAGMMLAQRNPVHAALSFALVVLSTCGLFLLNAAPFLMAATIVVYAGAIVVTFLFVIMLAQQEGLTSADQRSREPFLASVAGFVLLAAIVCVVHKTYDTDKLGALLDPIRQAKEAATSEEVRRILQVTLPVEDPEHIGSKVLRDLEAFFPAHERLLRNLEPVVTRIDIDRAAVAEKCQEILDKCRESLTAHGSLLADPELELSKRSGHSPAEAPSGTERLPAANVAGLGKSLFTDYLVPVQLAAVLLLVATVGAIAIAGRRGEGLR